VGTLSGERGLFVRDATGLVREIGFTLGVIIIMSNVVGLGWQKRAFQFSSIPVANEDMLMGLPPIFWAFLFGGIMVIVTGYVAGLVTAAMPRTGGGYVTISRVVHPFIGYIAAWFEFLSIGFSYGLIGTAVFEAIMIFFSIAGAPVSFTSDQLAIGGIIVILIFSALALFGVRLYGYIMHIMFWIPAVITLGFFAMWINGMMNPAVVTQGVLKTMGATPQEFVQFALDHGMAEAATTEFSGPLFYAMLGAFWAYIGYYAVTFLAGEVKEANVKVPNIVLASAVLIVVIYLLASGLSALAAMSVAATTVNGKTFTFFQAYSYLSYGPGEVRAAVYEAFPQFKAAWSTGLASIIAQGAGIGWLSWAIALAGVLWLANDIPPFLLTSSRTLFAMAFDRMLPEKLAYVSEKWHSPVWAIVAATVAGIVGAFAEASVSGQPGWVAANLAGKLNWAGVVGTDIFDALFLFFFTLSALLLPFRREDIYERSVVKLTKGTWAFLSFLAVVFSLSYIYMFTSVSWRDMIEPFNLAGYIGLLVLGILLYGYYWHSNKAKGIDVRTIYTVIPPE
jgi:amino acid transporter